MVNKVEAWATSDGETFRTEAAALAHEARVRLKDAYHRVPGVPPHDCGEWVEWMITHASIIRHALQPTERLGALASQPPTKADA